MAQNEYLFVEKYRPQVIDDCILPSALKKTFKDIVKSGVLPNLILSGVPGCGKTTVARALCNELGVDVMFINGSENGGIDTLRTTIRNFASAVTLNESGRYKVVIIDEVDGSGGNSMFQTGLRAFLEEFASNCRFILTCNYKNRIIEPLHSRCTIIDFISQSKEKPKLAQELLTRIKSILATEKISYDEKVLVELIIRRFPDFRRILGEIQTYSMSGKIDEGILIRQSDINISELLSCMKAKNFTDVRKWVAANAQMDHATLFRKIYDGLSEHFDKKCIPQIIIILAEYQYKISFSADAEICLAACMVEIMMNAEFKT